MALRVETIIIGDEILNGTVTDTNSAHLGQRAAELGVEIRWRQVVPDVIEEIVGAFTIAAARADVIVTSGGLGPTVDDRTAEAAARFLGEAVVEHPAARAQIEAHRTRAGRLMRDLDIKQAMLPESARVLENTVGTAPAFGFSGGEAAFFCLPGVPREWRVLLERYVLPALTSGDAVAPASRTWKFFGVTESELATHLNALQAETEGLALHYRAHFPEIHLTVVASDAERLGALHGAMMARGLDRRWFGGAGAELPAVVNQLLRDRGWTVATAESCTGGMVAQLITSAPGASDVFGWGAVTYANAAKASVVGVPEALLAEHGAVSQPVAEAMARGAREWSGATLGVAITGIAGPGGGRPDKPVGTVHFALAWPDGVRHKRLRFPFERAQTRQLSAWVALDLIRQHCMRS